MSKSKNMKMYTKLLIAFCIIFFLIMISLYIGYSTAATIITVDNPKHYLSSYAIFVVAEFAVMTMVTTITSIGILREIRLGMKEVTLVADELAAGKVDISIEKSNNDEFGEILDDFQKIVNNIRYDAKIAQEVADGNLTVEVKAKSDEDVMCNALKKMVEHNRNSLRHINDAAHQVTTGAAQVASASEALAEGSTDQASAIQQITASITDIAEKTRQNAERANAAANMMGQAIDTVKTGNKDMHEMVAAMQEINSASENISKIIKVIDDIAFQTNILALNAAVEAARAGEAGKGFAVVAEEVRNLAAKSASAAAETAEMIEDSIHKVDAGSRIAGETAKALEDITKVVKNSETFVNEIADASNYQATAIAQIDQAINQVSQVVQTNSATSEECAAASQELSNQASRVKDLIALYKL